MNVGVESDDSDVVPVIVGSCFAGVFGDSDGGCQSGCLLLLNPAVGVWVIEGPRGCVGVFGARDGGFQSGLLLLLLLDGATVVDGLLIVGDFVLVIGNGVGDGIIVGW